MTTMNNSTTDISIDDDAELLALAELLDAPDESKSKSKPETSQTKAPRLREDSTFAEAFSYELDLPIAKAAAKHAASVIEKEPDSSDDEEVKNFLERKYNEYGSDINKRLKQKNQEKHEAKIAHDVQQQLSRNCATNQAESAESQCQIKNPHQPKMRQSLLSTSFTKITTPTQSKNSQAQPVAATTFAAQVSTPIFTDPVFGLRIINPLISSTLLTERMAGRKSVAFSAMALHIERGDLTKDWVFAGAVVTKSPVQMSKKGTPYSIWRLSDLRGEIKMISLFLFSGAHKDLWKTAQGMCIAVLNPTIFEKRAKSDDVACLSIDTAQKVLVLGQSKDLGTCKARKKNGEPCTAVINLSECDYCIFHMKQEYSKMSMRSDLQSSAMGGGLNELRNKVLGKSEVFYGGQSFTAIPAKKNTKLTKKDTERLSTLSEYAVSPFAGSVNHQSKSKSANKTIPYAAQTAHVSKLAANVESNAKQRQKDLERLRILQAESTPKSNENAAAAASSSSTACSTTPTPSLSSPNVPEKYKNCNFSFSARTPQLSRKNFCIEVNIGDKRAAFAKHKAAQLLKQRPLEKLNPNAIRGTQTGKKRAIDELNEKFQSNDFKRQRLEEELREKERKSRIQRIMDASSSHTNLVDLREQEEQDKYFNKLEKKEALEEKMLNTYKVPCKAVVCQRCKYTALSAAERCKTEKHPLKLIDAEKRFFKCKDCGNRTISVFKLPKTSCKNCKSSRWERAAMIRDRKICNTAEGLSVRGDEEMFIGSLAGNANLNLLVADD